MVMSCAEPKTRPSGAIPEPWKLTSRQLFIVAFGLGLVCGLALALAVVIAVRFAGASS